MSPQRIGRDEGGNARPAQITGDRGGSLIDLTTRVTIARPPAEVFAFVSDQCNAPLWQTGLLEVRRLTTGALRVGSEHEFVRIFLGRRIASRNRFVAFRPDTYVEFEIPSGRITGSASYRTEADQLGGTVLTSRMQFRLRGALAPLKPFLARALINDTRRDEQRLKVLLEQNAVAQSHPGDAAG